MDIPIKKLRKKADVKNEFDEEEDIDVCNFSEGEPVLEGTLLRSFVFDDSSAEPIEVPLTSDNNDSLPINSSNNNNGNNILTNNDASNLSNKKISSTPEPKEDILDYRFSKTNLLAGLLLLMVRLMIWLGVIL